MLHLPEQPAAQPSQRLICEGDLVIVYERYDSMKSAVVAPKGRFDNRWGTFYMKEWIGKPFGTKVTAGGREGGWVYLLAPTPELWTLVLKHRTQILYVADISMVTTFLELAPGDVVIESGTGSGSLTTSLARSISPGGHVHTFEHHEARADAARSEFQQNGLADAVTVSHRDIEGTGFPAELHGKAHGVFLDLPGPWKAVPSAVACLIPDGVFISFSPCIEQIQRTCEALVAAGCIKLRTFECLLRQYEVTSVHMSTDLDAAPRPFGGARKRKHDASNQGQAQLPAAADAQRHMTLAKPSMAARGHTGYLLVARKAVAVD